MVLKASTLYIVGTPIGNLGDLSPRAAQVLSAVDFIVAEDTRVTRKLLNHLRVKGTLLSYHAHSKPDREEEVVTLLKGGACGAMCTDAGMPCISDPGDRLVRLCHEEGLSVEVVPGPSAVSAAIALSGIEANRYCFEGFLPPKGVSRRQRLDELATEQRTVVLFEAPHRLTATLQDLLSALGDRTVAVCKEMTKLHEHTTRTSLSNALQFYKKGTDGRGALKGEYVLVVEGCRAQKKPDIDVDETRAALMSALESGSSGKDAVLNVSERLCISRNVVYRILQQILRDQ